MPPLCPLCCGLELSSQVPGLNAAALPQKSGDRLCWISPNATTNDPLDPECKPRFRDCILNIVWDEERHVSLRYEDIAIGTSWSSSSGSKWWSTLYAGKIRSFFN